MDIVVKDLNALDQISICTRNSEYHFQVIDPAECRGLLSGGVCGEEQYEAVLVGTVDPKHNRCQISAKLETGTCAFFYIATKESLTCLITSAITR